MSGAVNISQRDAYRRRRDKQIVQAIGGYISQGSGGSTGGGSGADTGIDVTSLFSEIFEVVNPGQADQYLRIKLPVAGDYEIQALSDPDWSPSGAGSRAFQTPEFSDPLELDATTNKDFKCGLITADTTINLNGTSDGDAGMIEITMDSTGGYAVSLGSMFRKRLGYLDLVTDADTDNFISWRNVSGDIVYTIGQITQVNPDYS